MSADDKLGLVYMGTGNAAGDFYGTERTPEEEEYTASLEARYDGMYTPPMLGGTIAYPGNHGGLNWGGLSVDRQQGVMVMNTNRLPYYEQLFTRDEINKVGSTSLNEHGRSLGYMPQVGLPVGAKKNPWLSVIGVPCITPPWGYLTGIDLHTKEVVWQRPFGTGYDSGPFNIPSCIKLTMGTPSDSGALTTGGGVTIIGAALDNFMRASAARRAGDAGACGLFP